MRLLSSALLGALTLASAQEISLLASSSRGDGGPAESALLDGPFALALAPNGDLYFAELHAGVIRRLREGVVERVAGTRVRQDGPEGRPAPETDLHTPSALLVDPRTGELIFADAGSCRIRKIAADGRIVNLAGTGRCAGAAAGGFPFPGGGLNRERLALDTDLGGVTALVLDPEGRLVFSEELQHQVRRIDADGFVRAVAGFGAGGFSGDTGDAKDAQLNSPMGLAYDPAGNLYIADGRNCRVRRVDLEGKINTIAGTGSCASRSPSFTSGAAGRTALGRLSGIAYHAASESLYVSSPQQSRVLRLDLSTGRVTSVLGNGTLGVPDLARSASQFVLNEPAGLAVTPEGALFAAASTSFQIYRLDGTRVTLAAGKWPDASTLLRPTAVCLHAKDQALLVLDSGAERILRRDPASGEFQVFAGAASPTGFTSGDDGPAASAQLGDPRRLFCAPSGEVYLSQGSRIRVIGNDGVIRTARAGLSQPTGVALDAAGRLVYADAATHRVYSYDPGARSESVIAGTGAAGFAGDGGVATSAQLDAPTDLAYDAAGNLWIADRGNRRLRRVLASGGRIETIAGSAREFSYIDITGERASDVGFDPLSGFALAPGGGYFVAESTRLSRAGADGRIQVLAGYAGEDDAGTRAYRIRPLNGLQGLAPMPGGELVFCLAPEGALASLRPPED